MYRSHQEQVGLEELGEELLWGRVFEGVEPSGEKGGEREVRRSTVGVEETNMPITNYP